ncbi:hypothetical protein Q5752_004659 [Cryptotrichosporon argae]
MMADATTVNADVSAGPSSSGIGTIQTPPSPALPTLEARTRNRAPSLVDAGPSSAGPSSVRRDSAPASPPTQRRRSRPSWWTEEHERALPRSAEATPTPTAAAPPPPEPQYIQPWAFYPLNNHRGNGPITEPVPVPAGEVLSPEDDPQASRGIPVFKPTMKEFEDFEGYATKTTFWGRYSGIVKVIPPDEWTRALPPLDKRQLSDVRIKTPIQQNMIGKGGVFLQANMQKNKNKPLTIQQWFDKCHDKAFAAPSPIEADLTVNRDSKEAKERREAIKSQIEAEKQRKKAKREAAAARKRERELRESEMSAKANVEMDAVDGEKGKDEVEEAEEDVGGVHVEAEDAGAVPPLDAASHSSSEAMPTTPEADAVDPFFNDIDLRRAWLPKGANPEDYTAEACAKLERKFWKNLGVGEPSWYGADLQGTLFPDRNTPWNVANLPNLLNRPGLQTMPGVNTPYLYFGMWRAAFSWHVEDMDLFSINYIHFGAPKFWYAIPQQQAEKFERVVAGYFPGNAALCDQFMRHKSCTISPMSLAKDGIRVNSLVHNQNEFVITYPRGYHAGFNMGFNCAESINFALDSWVELGRRAKACECVDFSVRIDVEALLAEQNLVDVIEQERAERSKANGDGTPSNGRKRKRKSDAGVVKDEPTVETEADEPPAKKPPVVRSRKPKATIEVSEPNRPPAIARPKPAYPCLFCPSSDESDLAPILDASDAVRARSKSKDPNLRGHVSCALAIPELWLDESEQDGVQRTLVCGPDYVLKDRWTLKCSLCNNKQSAMMGAKIQCTKGKCTRAYHVSCAQASDLVHLSVTDRTEMHPKALPEGVELPDGPIEYEEVQITDVELLCPQHNPAVKDIKQRKAQAELRQRVLALQPDDMVKFRKSGTTWSAPFSRVLEEAQQVEVQMLYGTLLVDWKTLDFRPAEVRVIENEYAGPPKRSRKEAAGGAGAGAPAPAPLRPTDIANLVHPSPRIHPPPYAPTPDHVQPVHGFHGPYDGHTPPAVHNYDRVRIVDTKRPPVHANWAGGMVAVPTGRWVQPLARAAPLLGHHQSPLVPVVGPHALPPTYVSHGYGSALPPPGLPLNGESAASAQLPANIPVRMGAPAANGVGTIDLGLDRMLQLMVLFPPLRVPAIHLAGTNGKGSVSAILESCLRAAGLRTARYNSPHLVEPRDALRIDGVPPAAATYAHALERVQHAARSSGLEPTTFEIATAAAYLLFNEAQVDVMIIECGMGGARDATNVIPPDLVLAAGLTAIGLDHTDFLGPTITDITAEKVGIVPSGCNLVVAPNQHPDAVTTAVAIATQRGFRVIEALPGASRRTSSAVTLQPFSPPAPTLVSTPLPLAFNSPSISSGVQPSIETELHLPGAHQIDNLSLAVTLLHVIRYDQRALSVQPKLAALSDVAIKQGVAAAKWEGRCSWLQWRLSETQSLPVLVDGAHNADSAARLRAYIDSLGLRDRTTFVLALSHSATKPPRAVLAPLLRPHDRVVVADFSTPVAGMPWIRPADKDAVRAVAAQLVGPGGEAYAEASAGAEALDKAIKWATGRWPTEGPGLVVVCGSLYLVADAYRLMRA